MRKQYEEPVVLLRRYSIQCDIFTDSNPEGTGDNNLDDDDTYDYFGNN